METNMEEYIKDLENRLNLFEEAYLEMVDVNCGILKKFNEYMSSVNHVLTQVRWASNDIFKTAGFDEIMKDPDEGEIIALEIHKITIYKDDMNEILRDFQEIERTSQKLKDKTTELNNTIIKLYQQHQNSVDTNNSKDIIK